MRAQSSVLKTRQSTQAETKTGDQVLKAGLAAIGLAACAIGLWAAVSLIGGIVASGGPGSLLADWFRAVVG